MNTTSLQPVNNQQGAAVTTQQQNTQMISAGNESTIFSSLQSFVDAQRMADMLSKSTLIPKQFQGNLPDTVIALELSQRMMASPLAIMQSVHIIHGRPSFSATFIIACINACGRYSPLRYKIEDLGEKTVDAVTSVWDQQQRKKVNKVTKVTIKDMSCQAYAIELATGETLYGPPVTIEMAALEGWLEKDGSKWKTMPETMIRYRAASFFGRLYAPDLLNGMRTREELIDTAITGEPDDNNGNPRKATAADLNARFSGKTINQETDAPIAKCETVDTKTGETTPAPKEQTIPPKVDVTPPAREEQTPPPQQEASPPPAEEKKTIIKPRPAIVRKFKEQLATDYEVTNYEEWKASYTAAIQHECPHEKDVEELQEHANITFACRGFIDEINEKRTADEVNTWAEKHWSRVERLCPVAAAQDKIRQHCLDKITEFRGGSALYPSVEEGRQAPPPEENEPRKQDSPKLAEYKRTIDGFTDPIALDSWAATNWQSAENQLSPEEFDEMINYKEARLSSLSDNGEG